MSDLQQRAELGRFLKDRRGRLRPEDVGLPTTPRRRVRGLRREEVALLARIGVSWYTALENGDASGVSTATLNEIADALRLTESERHYLFGLARDTSEHDEIATPRPLDVDAITGIAYPAYLITADWQILAYNAAFRRVWGVGDDPPIDAISRLYLDPAARALHGEHFATNVTPIVAMVRSGIGRRPHLERLRTIGERFANDDATRPIWEAFEISGPLVPTRATIASRIGTFRFETLTLPIESGFYGIVIDVPDPESRDRLARATERETQEADVTPSARATSPP